MARTAIPGLACSVGLLVAGCSAGAGGGVGAGRTAGAYGTAPSGSAVLAGEAAGPARDFNLRVKCPGIHLEKTRFKWPDARVVAYENVTREQIAECEGWWAAQPKGYVPRPAAGHVSKGGVAQDLTPQQTAPPLAGSAN